MTSFEVRDAFVNYFKRNGHTHVGSSSLIPEDDPTLMFANAGMNQFKNAFLGLEKRDYKRAVTVQKCVRAGGKHNDLENVGFTARHHTFFEMLGNFSFGDYFKKDAIRFAWELLTKDLQIPKEKLYVTVFETDDEAADIWHKQEGVPRERIFRFGEKDNFWRMGDTGPCGPCSEIFYDHGPKAGKIADPYKGILAGEDRYVEIWNLVFMQFYEKSPGVMDPLPKPSVDTGSGLERVVAVMQGKLNNYDTDLFTPLIERACQPVGWNLEEMLAVEDAYRTDENAKGLGDRTALQVKEEIAALRVMADHTRAASFLMADGAIPSNEGRGYVLRRILRRAIRYGRKISPQQSFIPMLADTFVKHMSSVYPELQQRRDVIVTTLQEEESRFLQTLDTGTELLNNEFKSLSSKKQKKLAGEFSFRLYDTFGFPLDLTRLMAAEKGFEVDEVEFDQHMEKARKLAQASGKFKAAADDGHILAWTQNQKQKETRFTGYAATNDKSKILALSDGKEEVQSLAAGSAGLIITEATPFYGESGCQIGDRGEIFSGGGKATVQDTTKHQGLFVHHVSVASGKLTVGDQVTMVVEDNDRRRTASNHSATHLMHSALRKVLGTHVSQAGSLVDAMKTRFDFTHNKAVSKEEIAQIEALVNHEIALAHPVEPKVMGYKEAIASGAMALFGEKYGNEVRVLRMGDFSCELCGGTHVANTAQIRLFKIVSESGVSAGVRRIEAITGDGALQYLLKNAEENQRARTAAGISESWSTYLESKNQVSDWVESTKSQMKDLEKSVRQAKSSTVNLDEIIAKSESFAMKGSNHRLVAWNVEVDDRDVLAQWADQLKNKIQSGVVVVLGKGESTHPLIVTVSKNLNPEVSAGGLLKDLAHAMGGKGGGRPDFAQGAVPEREGWSKALGGVRNQLGLKS